MRLMRFALPGLVMIMAAVAAPSTATVERTVAQVQPGDKPFAVEYYYKVKWGSAEEFIQLYRRNHHPLLKKQMSEGRILELKTEAPFYHAGEESRWDYRVTIVWKNSQVAHDDYDDSVTRKQLFPDQERFRVEEQRRFELLQAHWDVAVVAVDMEKR